MTTKYGEFSEPGYLKPGALYDKVVRKKADATGSSERASFRAGQALRTGKLNDATFSKFQSTNIGLGDGLLDADRSAKAGTSGKEAEIKPFRPANPMKKSGAPQAGDYNGTFSRTEHVKGAPAPTPKKGDFKSVPRAIYAHGPRSGGYGTNNFTLSQLVKGSKGVAGEYAYMADPIHEAKRVDKDEKAEKTPFRPAQGTSRTGVFNKLLYQAPAKEEKLTKQAMAEKAHKGPAFFPPAGRRPALQPIQYLADPLPEAEVHKKSDAAAKAAWKPGPTTRSTYSPSIVRMNA